MPVASCIPFPFSAPCDDVLIMLVCATHWLSLYLYTLAYMSMQKPCLLVCRPCFNTMKLWTSKPNLHFSLADTTFCLLSCLLAFLLVCLFACLLAFLLCLLCLSCLFALCLFPILFASLLPSLVYWFLVFDFVSTHTEQGCTELGHGLLGTSKKGANASM